MVTDWITAVSTAATVLLGIISYVGAMQIKKLAIRKRKQGDIEELLHYMDWVRETKTFLREIFKPLYNNLLTEDVLKKCIGYNVNEIKRVSDLEKLSNKIKPELSKNQKNQFTSFIDGVSKYIYLYGDFVNRLLEKKNCKRKFNKVKKKLKQTAPKEMIFLLGLSEDSELSEYFFSYIRKLEDEWKIIEEFLSIKK